MQLFNYVSDFTPVISELSPSSSASVPHSVGLPVPVSYHWSPTV